MARCNGKAGGELSSSVVCRLSPEFATNLLRDIYTEAKTKNTNWIVCVCVYVYDGLAGVYVICQMLRS